jgi:hypothetical protein
VVHEKTLQVVVITKSDQITGTWSYFSLACIAMVKTKQRIN